MKLATPSYQKKKERRDLKLQTEQSASTLVDPTLVSVIGVVKNGEPKNSEEASNTPTGGKVKKNAVSSEEASSSPTKANKSPEDGVVKDKAKKKPSPPTRSTRPTTDSKLEAMDTKWSERFSRLEALLLSKSLSQTEPCFQQVKITPVKVPPAGVSHSAEPLFETAPLTNRPKSPLPLTSDRPLSSHRPVRPTEG